MTGLPRDPRHDPVLRDEVVAALAIGPGERHVDATFGAGGYTRAMLAAGLVDEVVGLRARYALDAGLPSMRAVGYRQVWETLEGQASAATLEARGVAATRQLAKRQLTWLRAMREVERLDCLRPDLAAEVAGRVGRFLDGR